MSNSHSLMNSLEESASLQLPLSSMVHALCNAAMGGSDQLYEVMIKLTLMIDATAHTYGLATWTQMKGERPRLKWAEGLDEAEITDAERIVSDTFNSAKPALEIKAGDQHICMVLAVASFKREGAAIFGRCVRPLSEKQAKELKLLLDVAQLAHSHVALLDDRHQQFKAQSLS